ncbi:hypothetical protein MJO28_011407 [Puccinia striiformis f. sp. tritici]|uniref:Uncharacterized protein n=1 Tax=Puccinia striiformis f. sp. tritici TaxID=168172 RepID=A0ACC0E425_9BASI|nr:hypothetical protein MJO28_011407 [Puccinia striiformis f. sp. tritici]
MSLQTLKQKNTVGTMNPPCRPHLPGPVDFPSSRHYSVVEIYPAPPSLGLEPNSSVDTSMAQPGSSEEPNLAHDKVENWTSRVHANQPFQPDFTLFEPIEPMSANTAPVQDLKSRIDSSLSDRLVYLIQNDPEAAEQSRSEIIKSAINLPTNLQITSHSFDLLFRGKQHQILSGMASTLHLNHILKSSPNDLVSIVKFLEILVAKDCYSRHLAFTVIRHLVRTQNPTTTISAIRKICLTVKKLPSPGELIKSSYDFLVVQLANQGHLSEAIQVFSTSSQEPKCSSNKAFPLTYQVLADQLVSRIKDESLQSRQHWSDMLDSLISRWRVDHNPSLNVWLAKKSEYPEPLNLLPPSLTKQISKKYAKLFNKASSVNPEVCHQIYVEKLEHFTSYFRSLFDQNDHPKFVKAAQLANKIHQIIPLRNSLENILEKLHQSGTERYVGTDEQIIKSFVLEPPHVLCDKPGQLVNQRTKLCPKFTFENRSDIVFLWAHSWMIFYHRSRQPRRVIEIFLEYFIPIGCDVKLLNQIRWGPKQSDSSSIDNRSKESSTVDHPLPEQQEQKYQKLIHPTVGVLTVLYDSILSICPPKLIPIIFDSFLTQHFHPSEISSSLSSSPFGHSMRSINKRLEPNLGSFRPFVRACLKAKDVDGALKILESMHTYLDKKLNQSGGGGEQDEGGWIDLLEWCAIHSSGPKPKQFNPNYRWGDLRRKKLNGWDGKMKEDLIFLVLQNFFLLKFNTFPSLAIQHSTHDFLENHRVVCSSEMKNNHQSNILEGLKIFTIKNPLIQSKLKFLIPESSSTHPSQYICLQNFPSLKLIAKIRYGFRLAQNSKGLKIVDKLLNHYK